MSLRSFVVATRSFVMATGLAMTLLLPIAALPVGAQNKITILHEGYVAPIEGKTFLPGAAPDGARKVASTIGLIEGDGFILITEPGFVGPGAWPRIIQQLKDKGIEAEDVTHVFISHHHPDHTVRVGAFANATVIDFWATYKDDVWSDHPDDYEILPGVTILRTPGHTEEDATLLVDTDDGVYAFTHLWWSPGYQPDKDPLAHSDGDIEKHRDVVLKRADWIVPGHGAAFKNTRK